MFDADMFLFLPVQDLMSTYRIFQCTQMDQIVEFLCFFSLYLTQYAQDEMLRKDSYLFKLVYRQLLFTTYDVQNEHMHINSQSLV